MTTRERPKRRAACALALGAVCAMAAIVRPAHAAPPSPTIDLSPVDGVLIVGSLLGTLAMSRLPVEKTYWNDELLAIDRGTRGTYSSTHALITDALAVTTLTGPVVAEVVRGDSERLSKGVVYIEVLSVGGFLNAIAKYTVQRPRPFSYSTDPRVMRYTESEGKNAYISFFSGHATTTFAAAVGGSYLFAYGNPNTGSRAFMWGFEMAFASATSMGRIRAGKHFPSDVLLGAAVGTGIGILVPRAHMSDRSAVSLEPAEWAAIGGGLLLGTAISAALPAFPLAREDNDAGPRFSFVPTLSPTSAGLSARGTF